MSLYYLNIPELDAPEMSFSGDGKSFPSNYEINSLDQMIKSILGGRFIVDGRNKSARFSNNTDFIEKVIEGEPKYKEFFDKYIIEILEKKGFETDPNNIYNMMKGLSPLVNIVFPFNYTTTPGWLKNSKLYKDLEDSSVFEVIEDDLNNIGNMPIYKYEEYIDDLQDKLRGKLSDEDLMDVEDSLDGYYSKLVMDRESDQVNNKTFVPVKITIKDAINDETIKEKDVSVYTKLSIPIDQKITGDILDKYRNAGGDFKKIRSKNNLQKKVDRDLERYGKTNLDNFLSTLDESIKDFPVEKEISNKNTREFLLSDNDNENKSIVNSLLNYAINNNKKIDIQDMSPSDFRIQQDGNFNGAILSKNTSTPGTIYKLFDLYRFEFNDMDSVTDMLKYVIGGEGDPKFIKKGREKKIPVLNKKDFYTSTNDEDYLRLLNPLSGGKVSSLVGRDLIEKYQTRNPNNYENYYIDKTMADAIKRNKKPIGIKNFFTVDKNGNITKRKGAKRKYTYEHLTPVLALTRMINFIHLKRNKEGNPDKVSSDVEKILDKFYTIAYIENQKGDRLNRWLQSEAPDLVYDKLSVKPDNLKSGKEEKYPTLTSKSGNMTADEFMNRVDSINFEDMLQRYSGMGIEIESLDGFFEKEDSISLDNFTANDLNLPTTSISENRKPVLTNILFGYYE